MPPVNYTGGIDYIEESIKSLCHSEERSDEESVSQKGYGLPRTCGARNDRKNEDV